MITSLALMSIYRAPAVPLSEICDRYLGLSYEEAMRKAARNELPVPTFRLAESRKAPVMVSLEELGAWIDQTAEKARAQWQRSQV